MNAGLKSRVPAATPPGKMALPRRFRVRHAELSLDSAGGGLRKLKLETQTFRERAMRSTLIAAVGFATIVTGPAMTTPARAEDQLSAEQARAFVVGREFSFTCFEGSKGSGRVYADGSVAGIITLKEAPARFVRLPANTLRVRSGAVCGYVKGMSFEPCFDVVKTGPASFRGTLAGVQTMWCDFQRAGKDRPQMAARRSRARSAAQEASAE